jgi:hypothetical protein
MGMIKSLRKAARPVARVGCVSIGTVYALVGVLALLALSGVFTGSADEDRMVHVLKGVPGGQIVIWAIVLGLLGYVGWRLLEVIADPYEFGSHGRGLAIRIGVGLSALAYGVLAFSAAQIAVTGSANGEDAEVQQQMLVGRVLEWPGGMWWVGGAGILLAAAAVLQLGLIARRSYTIELCLDDMSGTTRTLTHVLAWAGYAARSVILGVLGYFLIRAAYRHDPEEVGDTDTAFDFIGGGVIGDSAFFLVALGTVGYGMFMYLNAVYYRFEKDPEG